MKRFLCIFFLVFFMCGCVENDITSPTTSKVNTEKKVTTQEFRGVWISCFDLQKFDFSTEIKFRESVTKTFDYVKNLKLNTVIVQVRPFADAIYPSEIFPWSDFILKDIVPNYDPLEIMIEIAKEYNLSFHAWVNPYRISSNNDYNKLNHSSPARPFIKENKSDVVICDKGIYFNPASLSAQSIIISGIREIAEKYDVDAIHIDDYFYPTTDVGFDKAFYKQYKSDGGKLKLEDWRRENINCLISGIHTAIKNTGSDIVFGVSPGGNIEYNYTSLYADVKTWCNNGYVDYIIPQIYFGFKNTTKPFAETTQEWSDVVYHSNVNLYCGLAFYKCGNVDEFCSDENSQNEWKENTDIIKRQIEYIRKNNQFSGFALFSFRNLSEFTNENFKNELQNMRSVL